MTEDVRPTLLRWTLLHRIPLLGAYLANVGRDRLAERADEDPDLARALARVQRTQVHPAAYALRDEVLLRLGSAGSADALVEEWVQRRDPDLARIVAQAEWVATSQPRLRVLSSLLLDFTESLRTCAPSLVSHIARAADDPDAQIARSAYQVLLDLREPDTREELCRLVLRGELRAARRACVEAGYTPASASERALYFLLTEQWARYDALDFERTLLREAYNAADRDLRRAVVLAIRRAGRLDLTSALRGAARRGTMGRGAAGRGGSREGPSLSLPEAELLVQVLRDHGEWEQLWEAVFDLSVVGSARAVRGLHRAGWRPSAPDQRAAFDELVQIALDPTWDTSEVRLAAGMPLEPHVVLPVPEGVRDIAFHPQRSLLAVGIGDRTIRLWDCDNDDPPEDLGPYPGGVSHLTFTGQGMLVWSESNDPSREEVGLHLWDAGVVRRIGSARSFVSGLHSCGPRQVLCSTVVGAFLHVRLLDAVTGIAVSTRHISSYGPGGGRPSTATSPDGSRVAIVSGAGRLDVHRLPDLEPLTLPRAETRGLVERVSFAPDDASVLFATHAGTVHEARWDGDELVEDFHPLARHNGPVRGLASLRMGSAILSVCDSELRATSWLDRERLGSIPHGQERVLEIAVSRDEEWLAVATPNGVAVWDLQLLAIFLLTGSLSRAGPRHLTVVEEAARTADVGRGGRLLLRYLSCVLRHRFRFAFELDDPLGFGSDVGTDPGAGFADIDIDSDID